jgi:hypothetical protein
LLVSLSFARVFGTKQERLTCEFVCGALCEFPKLP